MNSATARRAGLRVRLYFWTRREIATEDAIPTDRVRKAIRYAFLAPDIVRAIVEGRQPVGLTSSYLLHHPLPDDWEKQRVLVKTL